MPTLPSAGKSNSLLPSTVSPWLAPIRFGVKPYFELCRSFDQSLAELEARYPSHTRMLTIEGRTKKLSRKRKSK